jgi:hypothetical protein
MPQPHSVLATRKHNNNYNPEDNNGLGLTKDGRKKWKKPKKLTAEELILVNQDLHMELAAGLQLQGYSWVAISERLEVPLNYLNLWKTTPKYLEIYGKQLNIYKKEQKSYLLSLVPIALKTMEDLMVNSSSGHVRYEAAQAILTHAEVADDGVAQETAADHSSFLDSLRKKAKEVSHQMVQVNINTNPVNAAMKTIDGEAHLLN